MKIGRHIFGNDGEKYTTLDCSVDLDKTTSGLDFFSGWGEPRGEYLQTLHVLPALWGRPLRHSKNIYLLTRVFPGKPDHAGRQTLLFETLILQTKDWVGEVSPSLAQWARSSQRWTHHPDNASTKKQPSIPPEQNAPELIHSLVSKLRSPTRTRTTQVLQPDALNLDGLSHLLTKLADPVKATLSFALRPLSDDLPVELLIPDRRYQPIGTPVSRLKPSPRAQEKSDNAPKEKQTLALDPESTEPLSMTRQVTIAFTVLFACLIGIVFWTNAQFSQVESNQEQIETAVNAGFKQKLADLQYSWGEQLGDPETGIVKPVLTAQAKMQTVIDKNQKAVDSEFTEQSNHINTLEGTLSKSVEDLAGLGNRIVELQENVKTLQDNAGLIPALKTELKEMQKTLKDRQEEIITNSDLQDHYIKELQTSVDQILEKVIQILNEDGEQEKSK